MLAAQVVYTNVEENRSPHRRRGFQLWLWSKELSKPVLDEVEQRVNTFARLTPAEEKQLRDGPPRRIFTPLVSAEYVMLAEAVPLEKKDKFGRGGRFHTHAVLIDREQFAAGGGDPFSIFGGGFQFQRDPDASELDPVWKAIHLPEVELPTDEPHAPPVPPALAPLVPELVAWLLADEPAGMVALPVPAADAEAVLREVMRLLPPAARRRLSFDTLWTGRGRHAPRVGGAGSPQLLQAWTFRRFVRFDPARKAIHPPLPVRSPWAKELAMWWANTPELTAEDRTAALALAEWVDGTEPVPPPATKPAAEWAKGLSRVAERWEQAKQASAGRAIPELVRRLPEVDAKVLEYFGKWGAEGIARVRTELTTLKCIGWVSEAVFPHEQLDPATARSLLEWRANDKSAEGRKLCLAASRWLPEHLEFVCGELRGSVTPNGWFRDYCWATLPAAYRDEGGVDAVVGEALRAMLAREVLPARVVLFEALAAGTDREGESLDRLRLLLRAEGYLGAEPDRLLRERPHLFEWAADHLLAVAPGGLEYVTLELPDELREHYWGRFFPSDPSPLALIGVRLPPDGGPLLGAFAQRLRDDFLARLDRRFDRQQFPREESPVGVEKEPGWRECDAAVVKKTCGKLTTALRGASDGVYRKLAEDFLFPRASGRWACGELWDDGGWFAGAAVYLSDPNDGGRTLPLVHALAGSAVPVARAGADDRPEPDERSLNRFGWLVVRLLTGVHSGSLGIPPR